MDGPGWNPKPQTTSKPLELLGRTEWAAQPPKWTDALDLPVNKLFLSATGRQTCYSVRVCTGELQRIQNFHMKIEMIPDIRYNFIIGGKGIVYEGRGWNVKPNLPKMYDSLENKALFIGFTGDFRDPKIAVPPEMLEAMDLLIKLGIDYKYISPDYETFDL
ncbi:peptidoglycan-recognition protein LF-like [Macrosteles quadrilineatus]|uniref:peptidoglycan-recognition protein LF-like n=1 Tax=Macrosteles quadrilineatus TaxID=74068 RepID=UPI0023E17B80|nr:peptidoglycan-recognition protein LF-like [Macrosteles quadrilineatus]